VESIGWLSVSRLLPMDSGRDCGQRGYDMVIEQQVRQFVAQNLLFSEDGYPFDDDASFLQEGIIDSLGVMELVAFAEKAFQIKVEPNDVIPDHFDSVSRLANYIRRKTTPLVSAVPQGS